MDSSNFSNRIVQHGSPEYWKLVDLRYDILRKPLGMHFTNEQLEQESSNYHLAIFQGDLPVACCMLLEKDNALQMKQVAVNEAAQGMGLGSKLLAFSESFAIDKGYSKMFCHARETAVPFYKKNGYLIIGDMFFEINIPHYYMEKEL